MKVKHDCIEMSGGNSDSGQYRKKCFMHIASNGYVGRELWPTSVSHLLSFLTHSLHLAGGKHYQKVLSTSLDLSPKSLRS